MMKIIEFDTPRLRLRQWRESDREPFATLNADPVVMEFFPALVSREVSDASINTWQSQFAERLLNCIPRVVGMVAHGIT